MHERRSEGRSWETPVREICAELRTFTYHDVRNEMMKDAYPTTNVPRRNMGCYIPTERQLQALLSKAPWCEEVTGPEKHKAAVYEYRRSGDDDR